MIAPATDMMKGHYDVALRVPVWSSILVIFRKASCMAQVIEGRVFSVSSHQKGDSKDR